MQVYIQRGAIINLKDPRFQVWVNKNVDPDDLEAVSFNLRHVKHIGLL